MVIVIGPKVRIGDNFQCFQGVTIGGNDKEISGRTMPKIGNNVTAFSGSVIIGPLSIGDNTSIGANSVVLTDAKSNVVLAGIPAKIVNQVEIAHSLKSQKNFKIG